MRLKLVVGEYERGLNTPQAPTNWFTRHSMEASPLTHGGFASTHESIMRPEKNKSEKAFSFL
jgi:hypothetical protein